LSALLETAEIRDVPEISVETKPAKPMIEFFTPSELAAFIPPDGSKLVGDYHIQKGAPFVMGGAPGVGKSRAAVSLAVAGATSEDWFGFKVHCQFKTMIVQAENGRVRLKNEFADLDCGALDEFVRVCSPPPLGFDFDNLLFCDQLRREIDKFRPDVLILDPFNRVARDDKAKDYKEAFESLLSVLPTGDDAPALGIVAHTRKPRSDERANGRALLNLLAGSYVIGSVPRAVFIMQAASDDTTDSRIVWTCCKNNDGELGKRSSWERRNGLFVPVNDFDWKTFECDGEKRRMVNLEDLDALFEGGKKQLAKGHAVTQLMEQTGLAKTACYQALKPDGKFGQNLLEQNGLLNFKS
jgi:AAA domain